MVLGRMSGRQIVLFFLIVFGTCVAEERLPAVDSSYLLEYQLPVSSEVDLSDVINSTQWQTSENGWIKESFDQWNFWFGDTPKVGWLKVTINDTVFEDSSTRTLWLELASSGLSRAELYYQNEQQQWISIHSEDSSQSPVFRNRFIAFQMDPDWIKSPIYIRAEATTKFHLQFHLQFNHNFLNDHQSTNAIFFVCYGILMVMVFYNLVLGKYLNDSLYYIYSLAISITLAYQIFAHGHSRLFFDANWDYVNHFLNFFAMLSAFSAMVFLYQFANFAQYTPKLASFFKQFLKFFFAATVLALILPTNTSLNLALLIAGPTPLIAMGFAIWCWRQGSPSAGIFVFAWSFYILGGFLWVLYWLGMVSLNHTVELPLVVGAALESILLSLALGYRIQVLQQQRSELQRSETYYKTISMMDPMTKLANRRAFGKHLANLQQHNLSFSLVLLDIDYFKQFNDSHGHLAGDKVIERLGKILQETVREDDLAARVGGEEFALIILNDNVEVARGIAERIRERFAKIPFYINDTIHHCTVSIGVSIVEPNETIEDLIERTDKALYRAKNKGRNQTQMSVKALTG